MVPESPDQRFAKTLIARVAATDARGSNAALLAVANISSPTTHSRETAEAHDAHEKIGDKGDKIVLFEESFASKKKCTSYMYVHIYV